MSSPLTLLKEECEIFPHHFSSFDWKRFQIKIGDVQSFVYESSKVEGKSEGLKRKESFLFT